MEEINLNIWFKDRELKTVPPHFIKGQTQLTQEGYFWAKSKLSGRFAVREDESKIEDFLFETSQRIYFEEPHEAMIYELRWSGSK